MGEQPRVPIHVCNLLSGKLAIYVWTYANWRLAAHNRVAK